MTCLLVLAAMIFAPIFSPWRTESTTKLVVAERVLSKMTSISPLFDPGTISLHLVAFPVRTRLMSFTVMQVSLLFLLTMNAKPSYPIGKTEGITLLFDFKYAISCLLYTSSTEIPSDVTDKTRKNDISTSENYEIDADALRRMIDKLLRLNTNSHLIFK